MKRAAIFAGIAVLAAFAVWSVWYKLKPNHKTVEASRPPASPTTSQVDRGEAELPPRNISGSSATRMESPGQLSTPKPGTGAERLRAEYTTIVSDRPILTNLYDRLALLSGRDPFDSDLFGDACLFLSARSSLLQLMDLDSKSLPSFRSRMDKYPEAERRKIQEMMENFERSAQETGLSLTNALESLSRIFSDRFEKRHGMNGDATVDQILNLGLPPGLMVHQDMPCP